MFIVLSQSDKIGQYPEWFDTQVQILELLFFSWRYMLKYRVQILYMYEVTFSITWTKIIIPSNIRLQQNIFFFHNFGNSNFLNSGVE